MQRSCVQRILSLAIILCIFCGMLPITGMAATAPRSISISDEVALREAAEVGGEITLTVDSISITEPIRIKANTTISIVGSSTKRTVLQAESSTLWGTNGSGVFIVEDNATVVFKNLVIDGGDITRCINVEGSGGNVTLDYVAIQHGNAFGGNGGGIYVVGGSGTLTVTNGCMFKENRTDTLIPSGGGAIYVGPGWTAHISPGEGHDRVDFIGNKSHSGACLYSYQSHVFAEGCSFGGQTGSSGQNIAGQRGGAIHSHGTVVLKDCFVMHNTSGQYGGGIYISADDFFSGTVVLDNTRVETNNAVNNGGGVFIASKAALYLRNRSTIINNALDSANEEVKAPEWSAKNNLYYSNALGRIILCDDSVGPVGISTANPYKQKLAVFSSNNSGLHEILYSAIAPIAAAYGYEIGEAYQMADGTYTDRITSDSQVWVLRDGGSDPEGKAVHGAGKMWFYINQGYTSEDNAVIFDYNVPEQQAKVIAGADLSEMASISLPEVPDIEANGGKVKFIFQGWYDQPAGGKRQTQPIAVTEDMGIKVYYAQWIIITVPEPIPGLPELYLVYFDQNYPGGGYTASYRVAGDFSFTVEYEFTGIDGEKHTGSELIEVKIPWGWPGNPYREGYEFLGWSLTPNGAVVNQGAWVPTDPDTTFYAQWEAHTHTLHWDTNGGSDINDTEQKHDETVAPPDNMPTKTGYRFTGWYLDKACTIPLTSGTLVRGPATFYAGWTEKEYLIAWDTNYTGGTGANYTAKIERWEVV